MTAPTLPEAPAATTAAGPRPLVVALDISLRSTGIAGDGWTDHIRTTLRGDARLDYLESTIKTFIRSADMIAMEGPSYGHGALAGHEDLAGLRVAVRMYCHRHRIPYAVIPPSSLKLYVADRGNATKGEVRSGVADKFGVHTEGTARYDEADAYGVLAAAYDWLGHPLATLPERNREAVTVR
ncbi:hypothetical protein AB0D49_08475 [Streptomyces sp. NPDC048290]|uniref:hypothetical protein n=1 Tax=Streptomyces sp. NPDC048290 TaxID=3155811 RepID=UPI003437AB60